MDFADSASAVDVDDADFVIGEEFADGLDVFFVDFKALGNGLCRDVVGAAADFEATENFAARDVDDDYEGDWVFLLDKPLGLGDFARVAVEDDAVDFIFTAFDGFCDEVVDDLRVDEGAGVLDFADFAVFKIAEKLAGAEPTPTEAGGKNLTLEAFAGSCWAKDDDHGVLLFYESFDLTS